MNTKPNSINPIVTHRVQPFGFIKVAALTGLFATGVIALAYNPASNEHKPPAAIPNVTPSTYSISALKLTSETSGKAVVKIDTFLVLVSFDFDKHPDSYGIPGSEFTAVDITNLAIEKITDMSGKDWNDFTDYNDHRNINQMIIGYIERNKLVEAF